MFIVAKTFKVGEPAKLIGVTPEPHVEPTGKTRAINVRHIFIAEGIDVRVKRDDLSFAENEKGLTRIVMVNGADDVYDEAWSVVSKMIGATPVEWAGEA